MRALIRKKLVIVSESFKRKTVPTEPIAALERFDGVYFRVLRKYLREGVLKNVDVAIVSPEYGILLSSERIPYDEPQIRRGVQKNTWRNGPGFDNEQTDRLRKKIISQLQLMMDEGKYGEVYVNLGRKFMALVDGLEKITKSQVVYATGKGLGPKAQHMKNWILAHKGKD